MADKLGEELNGYTQSLTDTFRLDCSSDDLKSSKEARDCYKRVRKIQKQSKKYRDFLSKQEVLWVRDKDRTDVMKLLGVALFFLGIIAALCCVVAGVVIAIQNPDMTEMRQLIEYPQPTIIGVISICVAWVGKVLCEW